MKDLLIGAAIIGGLVMLTIGWYLLKWIAIGLAHAAIRACLPLELKTLEWLQDRAMARTLGVDYETVRMRRIMETLRKPKDFRPN